VFTNIFVVFQFSLHDYLGDIFVGHIFVWLQTKTQQFISM